MSSDEEGPRGPVIPVNRGTARASIRSQSSRTVSRDKLTQLVHLRSPIKSSSVRVYQQSERSLGPLSDQLSGSGDSHNNIAVPARVPVILLTLMHRILI